MTNKNGHNNYWLPSLLEFIQTVFCLTFMLACVFFLKKKEFCSVLSFCLSKAHLKCLSLAKDYCLIVWKWKPLTNSTLAHIVCVLPLAASMTQSCCVKHQRWTEQLMRANSDWHRQGAYGKKERGRSNSRVAAVPASCHYKFLMSMLFVLWKKCCNMFSFCLGIFVCNCF